MMSKAQALQTQPRSEARLQSSTASSPPLSSAGRSNNSLLREDKLAAARKRLEKYQMDKKTKPSAAPVEVKEDDKSGLIPVPPSIPNPNDQKEAVLSPRVTRRTSQVSEEQSLKAELQELREKFEQEKKEIVAKHEEQLAELRLKLKQRSADNITFDEYQKVKRNYEQLESVQVERERKIEQLISDKDSLIEELQETKNALASSMNSRQSQDHLLKELNSLKESFNAKAQENDELSSIVDGLKQENIQLKAYIQDSMSSIQKSTDLESQAKESKNLLAARNEELRVLKVENYALVEQLNELRKHVVNLTNNNAILQDEYHDLKRKYNSVHKSTESVQSSTESISKDELIERLDFAVKQRDDFKAQLSDLSTKYQDIILQFEKVSHLNEQLQMELQTVPAYIEKYHEERKTLRAKALQKDRLVEKLVKQHEILLAKYQYLLSTLKSDSVDDNGETVAEIRKSRDLVDVAVEILEEQNQIGISTPNGIVRSSALRRLSAVTNGTILFPPCEDCLTDLVEV